MIRIRKMTNLSGRGFSPVLTPTDGDVVKPQAFNLALVHEYPVPVRLNRR